MVVSIIGLKQLIWTRITLRSLLSHIYSEVRGIEKLQIIARSGCFSKSQAVPHIWLKNLTDGSVQWFSLLSAILAVHPCTTQNTKDLGENLGYYTVLKNTFNSGGAFIGNEEAVSVTYRN